jgi:hypothetical protein
MSFGQMSLRANDLRANSSGRMSSGLMSSREMCLRTNVSAGPCLLGKCIPDKCHRTPVRHLTGDTISRMTFARRTFARIRSNVSDTKVTFNSHLDAKLAKASCSLGFILRFSRKFDDIYVGKNGYILNMGQIETLKFLLCEDDFKSIFNPEKILLFHFSP